MANLVVAKPQQGTNVVTVNNGSELTLEFSLTDTDYVRSGDDLVFSFPDGTVTIVKGFYQVYTPETFPQVLVSGDDTSTEIFFALPRTEVNQASEENSRLDGLDMGSERVENAVHPNAGPEASVGTASNSNAVQTQAQASQSVKVASDLNPTNSQVTQVTQADSQATAPQQGGTQTVTALDEHRNNMWDSSRLETGVRQLNPLDLGFFTEFFQRLQSGRRLC